MVGRQVGAILSRRQRVNRKQARQYVHRLVIGLLEESFSIERRSPFRLKAKHPLVYDELCGPELSGRRLSPADHERITDAMGALTGTLESYDGRDEFLAVLDKGKPSDPVPWVQANGKPGGKWKGYEAWLKKQGRT
jgi:hypothetical protein